MRNFMAMFICALAAGCSGVVGGDWSNGGSTNIEIPDGGSNSGGATATGGGASTGGAVGSGGSTITSTGGQTAVGTGGVASSGGRTGTGGRTSTGGAPATGGASVATGGRASTGGAAATGGRVGTGGAAAATGGRVGTGGASGGAAGAAGPAGETVFVGDFETGTLSQWAYIERCQTDRILVYSTANAPAGAPAPRGGQYAARFRVQNTDVAPCTSTENPRAELESPEALIKPGDERWEAWSVYIPSNHATPKCGSCANGDWMMFQEDYGAPFDGSASIAWFVDLSSSPNRFRMDRGEQYDHDSPGSSSLVVDRWIDFLVHKKFANTTSGGGFVEAWVDGKQVTFEGCGTNCTKLMTQTMHSTQKELAFYLTLYRAQGFLDSFEIYYDEARVGTTRASVELK